MSEQVPLDTPWDHILKALSSSPTVALLRNNAWEIFWALVLFSVIVLFVVAYRKTKDLDRVAFWIDRERYARSRQYEQLWSTDKWWVLTLLIDQWLRGLIPGDGIWTRENAQSLRKKKDKFALQKLIRIGIYPLYIQDGGGPTTAIEKEGGVSRWGWPTWPLYKQSKKRAVFEFVVPKARGWMIESENVMSRKEHQRRLDDKPYLELLHMLCFSKRLRRATRWRTVASGILFVNYEDLPEKEREMRRKYPNARQVFPLRPMIWRTKFPPDPIVPTERGATSRFRFLLPFKLDRTLREGYKAWKMGRVLNWLRYGRLLTKIDLPIVRMEAPEEDKIELDKELLLIAQSLGLDKEEWDEEIAKFDLRQLYREKQMEPVE